MVDAKRYNPSNKRFQKHTQHFVEGTTLKGHLNEEKDKKKDKYKTTGQLIRIKKAALYEKGWEVKVDKKTYFCNYGDNIVYLPPYTETSTYYIPKSKCEVEVSIDEKTKLHTVTRINDSNKIPIALTNKGVTLEGDGEAALEVTSDNVSVSGKSLSVENDVKVDTSKDEDLPDEISLVDIYKDVQIIKGQISDSNDDGD